MDHFANQVLGVINGHPEWATFVICLTAFAESFVFLSLLFPGTAILVAAGTLASEGTLDLASIVTAGIVGAVLGDSVSFWLGQRFGALLQALWPFRGHPERLERGIDFFERYGGASVFIGRFFGPLRAVVPTAAGMMHMPAWRFLCGKYLIGRYLGASACVFGRPFSPCPGAGKFRNESLLHCTRRGSRSRGGLLGQTPVSGAVDPWSCLSARARDP